MIKPVKSIQSITRYSGVQPATEKTIDNTAISKLDGNENPYGLPDTIRLTEDDYKSLHLYPDPLSSKLTEFLAKKEKLSFENVFVGAGSDELIDLLIRAYVEPNDIVLTVSPTFGMYKYLAEVNGVRFKSIEMQLLTTTTDEVARYQLDENKFLKEAKTAKVVFLARPNNPDGQLCSIDFILKLLLLNILVVIDEAYIEFASQSTLSGLLNKYDNLILLRTFSKAYALGGTRIGYGLMSDEVKNTLLTIKQPYNVNVIAQNLALKTLQSAEIIANVEKIIQTRNHFISELRNIAKNQQFYKIHVSEATFVLLSFFDKKIAFSFNQFMRKNGLLIRYYDSNDQITNIRISIGQENQMANVLEHIKNFLNAS